MIGLWVTDNLIFQNDGVFICDHYEQDVGELENELSKLSSYFCTPLCCFYYI